jgi:hypothetical protein
VNRCLIPARAGLVHFPILLHRHRELELRHALRAVERDRVEHRPDPESSQRRRPPRLRLLHDALGLHRRRIIECGNPRRAWNGASWKIQPTPTPAGSFQSTLDGIACPQRLRCFAVGNMGTGTGDRVTLGLQWR